MPGYGATDGGTRSFGYDNANRDDQQVVLDHARLWGADFSRRKLVQFSSAGSRLEACRFSESRIQSASFGAGQETSEYVECSFDRARIRFGPGGYSRFVHCSFRDVDLRDWFCFAVELVDCTFSGRLSKAFFNGTVPEDKRNVVGRDHNEFRRNDFSGIELSDVAFRTGVDLSEQRLPPGSEYLYLPDAARTVQRVREEVVGWIDLDLRQSAMIVIRLLEDELVGGQRQLLLRQDTFASLRKETVGAVFALLRRSALSEND